MQNEEVKLEEVIVEAKREGINEISTIDVSPDLLKKLPSLTGEVDLFKMLQLLPGVKAANELSSGLYVRGGSPDQTLTLVDGVIVYNPSHLGNIASTFNSNAIRDIRLIKGAFPSEYGGRLSSILDIKLRSGTKEREKGTIGLGLINSYLTLEGPLGPNSTYMVSGRGMYYDAIQKEFDKEGTTPRYNFYDFNSKINYTISETDIFSISGLFSRDKMYNPPRNELNYDIQWINKNLSMSWTHINSKSLLLNSSLSYIDYDFKSNLYSPTETSSNYFSSSKLQDVFLRQDAELHLDENNTGKTGLELAIHNYDLLLSDFYDEALESDPFSGKNITSLEAALYLQLESQITSEFKTNTGGRFYYFGDKKYFRFEPRISSSYNFTGDFSLKAAFAVAHQFLHLITRNDISLPTDLWYPSTKMIEPSKSTQYVFGSDLYLFDKNYLISVEGYYKEMKNLYEFNNNLQLDPFNDSIEEQLVKGIGEAYGIEFFFDKQAGNLKGWIGYTLSWTKRKFDELNGGRIFYPRYDRRHDVSAVIAYEITRQLSSGLTWTYSTGQRFTMPLGQYLFNNVGLDNNQEIKFNYTALNGFNLPSYHKMDLNVTYKFNWLNLSFETYLNFYNVYNRKNVYAYYIIPVNQNDGSKVKLNQVSLFPFIPSFGLNIKF